MARKQKNNRLLEAIRSTGAVRITIAVAIALGGGWLALALAISGIARYKNPQAALMVMPNDTAALAARADQLL